MKYRSLPAIYLSKSNEHGGHYLMNLYIGNRLHSYEWEEIHIDDYEIKIVEILDIAYNTPVMSD